MPFSPADLALIAARAATWQDRFGPDWEIIPPNGDAETETRRDARLARWCEVLADGDQETLTRRLRWEGWSDTEAVARLGAVRLAHGTEPPAWTATLRDLLEAAEEPAVDDDIPPGWLDEDVPLPFETVWLPFLRVATRRLQARAGRRAERLTDAAHASLARALLRRLADAGAQPLALEFSIFRAEDPFRWLGEAGFGAPDFHYRRFLRHLTAGGWRTLFLEYSVLARLVATFVDRWTIAIGDFLQHLDDDWNAIGPALLVGRPLAQIGAVTAGLSDPHHGGRSVLALTDVHGARVIYKPKDLALDAAYATLLDWLGDQGLPLAMRGCLVLARPTHGWAEVIAATPCSDRAAGARYYMRAGQLLCLVYALGGVDCHYENVIASAEHPVLIDVEALFHPRLAGSEDIPASSATTLAEVESARSVLGTGLLPQWAFSSDLPAFDISGLGGDGGQVVPFQVLRWRNINSDRMELAFESGRTSDRENQPSLDGAILSLAEYASEVEAGFRAMYRLLQDRKPALVAGDGPLAPLARAATRFVLRPTRFYVSVLNKLLTPEMLREGIDRSIELEILAREVMHADAEPPPQWPLWQDEARTLDEMDIPLLTVTPRGGDIVNGGRTVLEQGVEPSWPRVASRLAAFDAADEERQVAFLRAASYARVAEPASRGTIGDEAEGFVPLAAEVLVRVASEIAEDLRHRAFTAADGGASWIGFSNGPVTRQLQPLGPGLYDGVSGVALFLAAMSRLTGDAGARRLAIAALHTVRQQVRDGILVGHGESLGAGGVLYALAAISHLLELPELLDDASRLARGITPDVIAANRQFDVMAGTAGPLLGLLTLYETRDEDEVLARAVACGRYLLAHRVPGANGLRSWKTLNDRQLAGFSHGAAGIAYALLRLGDITGETDFRDAAVEAFAFEHSLYDAAAGNWPDLQHDRETPLYRASWCHGAIGIAMARAACRSSLNTAEVEHDLLAALAATIKAGMTDVDNVCCGTFGGIDALLVASDVLERPDLRATAASWAAGVVARAGETRCFHLLPQLPRGVFNAGFFQGTAGIGYGLLRVAFPGALPAVPLLSSLT